MLIYTQTLGSVPHASKALMGRGADPNILGNPLAVNGRHDLVMMYIKSLKDIGVFVESGAKIMIDNGWMEKPLVLLTVIHCPQSNFFKIRILEVRPLIC